jgi:ABC-2 type transport system permease protein
MNVTSHFVEGTMPSVVARRTRPGPPSAGSASLAFVWRGFLKVKHVPEQLADVILIPVLFTLVFTYLFGGALAGSTSEYLQFLLPGTLVMTVLLLTVYTGVGLNTDVTTGAFDRFRSLPIWRPAPIVGALLGDVFRYLLASALVVGLGLVMGFRPDGGAVGVLAAVALILLFAFSLSWIWTAVALLVRTPHTVNVVGLVFLFPLTFTSNAFVDPRTMPGWLQTFIDLNPVSHLVTAARALIHGSPAGEEVGWVLAGCAVLVAVFAPLTSHLYRRKN